MTTPRIVKFRYSDVTPHLGQALKEMKKYGAPKKGLEAASAAETILFCHALIREFDLKYGRDGSVRNRLGLDDQYYDMPLGTTSKKRAT